MTAKENKAGVYYLAGIGLVVALVGAVFVYLLWASFSQAKVTRTWKETPCLIIRSKINEKSDKHISKEYSWSVEYNYSFDGADYSSVFHKPRAAKWTSRKDEVEALVNLYSKDSKAVCFVNPGNPTQAILDHDSKAAGYSIWFPMLFVVGGLGITYSALKKSGINMNPC